MSDILLIGFCSFFITYVIRYTTGPFDIFIWFREKIGIVNLPIMRGNDITGYKESIETPDKFVTKLVACFWCFTTWITFVVSILYFALFVVPWALFPFLWLASAGLSAFLHAMVERNE